MKANNVSDDIDFYWSDVWLLQAIATASRKRPAALKDIIAAGDAIQHAIFSYEETDTGLAKLTASGYVVEEAGRFQLSPEFASVYAQLAKRTRSWTGNNEALERHLEAQPHPASDTSVNWSYPGLTRSDYDEAVGQYIDG